MMIRNKNYPEVYRTIVSGKVDYDLIAATRQTYLHKNAKLVSIIGGSFKDQVCLVCIAQHCFKTQFDWVESLGRFGVYTLGSVNVAKRWLLANQSV